MLDHHQQWALAAIVFWGMLLLTLSSWLRSYMSFIVWRVVHTLALAAFVLGAGAWDDCRHRLVTPDLSGVVREIRVGDYRRNGLPLLARRTSPAAPEKPPVGAASS